MAGELKRGDRIVIATHNKGKVKEIAELFASVGVETVSAAELGLPEPEETGQSFTENATIKAEAAAKATGIPAVADDSGLEVTALGVALLLTFPVWITVNYLGNPDNGVIFASYLGSLLMAGSCLAITAMTSAITRNQVVAFIMSMVILLLLILLVQKLIEQNLLPYV